MSGIKKLENFGEIYNLLHRHCILTFGFTEKQLFALNEMLAEPGKSAKRYASALQVSPATITTICDVFEERGIIKREHNSKGKDRRSITINLTRKGKNFISEVNLNLSALFHSVGLGSDKIADILKYMLGNARWK